MDDRKSQVLVDGQKIPSEIQQQYASQQQTSNRTHKRTLAQRRFTRAEKSLSEEMSETMMDISKLLFSSGTLN